ncbi:MAG: bifunctional transcriptional activator/DNA repair protein Ada [Candidatus Zixiibacteriota bacterium]|nr:MAG: bifunctional transcriptional activator/DNA repair protein Ada [candidate division Zixibacteria bacterium]
MPDRDEMIRVITERDTSFAGLFVVGVKSTGIFCRPGCPARTPRPKQMEFFATAGEALKAGYRACRRCRPKDIVEKPPALVEQLETLVRNNPASRITSEMLRKMGIDPSTARRQFQRYYGISFSGYQRATRLGTAHRAMSNGESAGNTSFDTGYESTSGFSAAVRKLFGEPPTRIAEQKCLPARLYETPLGAMIGIADDLGVHLLEFVDRRRLASEIKHIRGSLNCVIVPGKNLPLDQLALELEEYFAGNLPEFTVPIHIAGTTFECAVWNELRRIPYGTTVSYKDIAHRLNRVGAVRAVGRANGANKLALLVPCHRVVRADGSLCGYGGGLWRKKWLIRHEQQHRKSH